MKIKPRKVYLFYDQTELELVGLGTVYIVSRVIWITFLYIVDHECPVLSVYFYSHDKVFATVNENNLAVSIA